MCDSIEELKKKIENLEKTYGQLWELVWKKNTKIQELHNAYDRLEDRNEELDKTNNLLRTLIEKKDARIQKLHKDYDELNDVSIRLTRDRNELEKKNDELKKANNILAEECNKALMRNDEHGGEAKDLKEENEELKKQLANALDLYYERGNVLEELEDLKAAIKTILNSVYGVNGGKI